MEPLMEKFYSYDGLFDHELEDLQHDIENLLAAEQGTKSATSKKQKTAKADFERHYELLLDDLDNYLSRPPPTATRDVSQPLLDSNQRKQVRSLHNLIDQILSIEDAEVHEKLVDELDAAVLKLSTDLSTEPVQPSGVFVPDADDIKDTLNGDDDIVLPDMESQEGGDGEREEEDVFKLPEEFEWPHAIRNNSELIITELENDSEAGSEPDGADQNGRDNEKGMEGITGRADEESSASVHAAVEQDGDEDMAT